MLLAEEDAAVENKDASEAAPAPEATPTPATPTPLPSEEPAEETQNEELEPSTPTATPVETESPEATLEPTPVVTELPDPTPSVVPEVTPMPSNTPKVDGASNAETDDAETGEPLAPTPTPDVATAETAEDLSPQEIAAKVQENFGYSDKIMAYMTSDEIAALAFKMGIKVDREFYEYFDARTPMLMDAIDDDSSTIYNFIAWDGRVCVGANDVRYMAPGDYVISVIGLTSGLVKSISFTLPDNGQGEIVGGNPDGSLTTAQMRAMAASAVQLPTGILTGNSTIARCVAGDPVDMITGGLDWSYTDLSMEGDKQMAFVRSYNSRQGEKNAAGLGNGWSHNYNYKMDIFHDEIPCNLSEFLRIAEYRRMASMWEHMDRGFAHHLLHFPIFLFHVAPTHQVLDRPRQKNRTAQCRWRGHEQRISSIGTPNKSFRILLDNVLPIRAKTPFIEASCIFIFHCTFPFLYQV